MIMRTVAALVALAIVAGCSDDCGDVDCGAGLYVYWGPEELPSEVTQVRLCEDACAEPVSPKVYPGGGFSFVDGSGGPGERTVRLELLAADGSVVRTLVGTGDSTGKCCKNLSLRVSHDGRSLEEGSLDELHGLDGSRDR
jgi:hypothetical protein